MPATFADLGVPDDLVTVLRRGGVTSPFAIQAATLPDALAGRDVCGRAPTGSGKTIAFGLAVAARFRPASPKRPSVLILAPTRELARQIERALTPLVATRGGRVAAVYGGAGYEQQRKALRGAAVVVACPGRLEDLVQRGDVHLDAVHMVVLDEADRLADMGFVPAVRRLVDRTSADRQTLLFSATLDGEVDGLVRRYQHDPRRHEVGPTERDTGDVVHLFWRTDTAKRVSLTADLVTAHERAIVFCRTRHGADRLARQLAGVGVGSVALHGNRTQGQRERGLADFVAGRVQALVATDVAARGIHVDAVPCVVHFDPPADAKDYVHRSGRTGRAGANGTVVSLVTDDKRAAVGALQRALGMPARVDPPDLPTGTTNPTRRVHVQPTRKAASATAVAARPTHGRQRRRPARGARR